MSSIGLFGRTFGPIEPSHSSLWHRAESPPQGALSTSVRRATGKPRSASRHFREERAEAFRHRRMGDDRVAQPRIGHARQHSCLDHGDNFAGFGPDHGEAENAVAIRRNQHLHKAVRLRQGLCSQYGGNRQLGEANGDALASRFVFVQADMRERWIGEHAIGGQPAARRALAARHLVVNDSKVVEGCVSELRTAGAFADGPTSGALVASRSSTAM